MKDIFNYISSTDLLKKNEIFCLASIFRKILSSGLDLSAKTFSDYQASNDIPPDLHEIFACLTKQSIFMPDEQHSATMREIVASALAMLFFDEVVPAIEVARAADKWQLWDGFRSRVCERMQDHEAIQTFRDRFLELISSFQADPLKYHHISLSRPEYEELTEAWNKQTNISEVWKESWGWGINYLAPPGAACLQCLLPDNIMDLNRILAAIVLPWCLRDTLWILRPDSWILAMLECAPAVLDKNAAGDECWNKSILAPMLLQTALDYSIKSLEDTGQHSWNGQNASQPMPMLEKLWPNIIDIISKRSDGSFLGRAFLKSNMAHLFFERKIINDNSRVRFCIARQSAKLVHVEPSDSPKKLFEDVFDCNVETPRDICKHFVQTGLLAEENEKMRLASLLAFLAPQDANLPAEVAIDFLDLLLPYRNAGFHTSEHFPIPDIRHTLIGWLYAQCSNPLEAWLNTWSILACSRYKLRNSFFGDDSLNYRYVLNFVLVAGICASFQLKQEDQAQASASFLETVKEKIVSCSHWDWFQDKFFTKLSNLLALPTEEFICPFKI